MSAIYGRLGFSYEYRYIRIIHDGRPISPHDTISSLGIKDQGVIDVDLGQTAGHQSGTFLFSSRPLKAVVNLKLSDQWQSEFHPLRTFQWAVDYAGDSKPVIPSVRWLSKLYGCRNARLHRELTVSKQVHSRRRDKPKSQR